MDLEVNFEILKPLMLTFLCSFADISLSLLQDDYQTEQQRSPGTVTSQTGQPDQNLGLNGPVLQSQYT